MEQKIYDIIIIGSGPAGLCAAIYAKRAQLDMLVIEKDFSSGGQMVKTYEVDNYPGLPGMSGYDMAESFRSHADKLGAAFVRENVKEVRTDGDLKEILQEPLSLQPAPDTGHWEYQVRKNFPEWVFPTARPVTAHFSKTESRL